MLPYLPLSLIFPKHLLSSSQKEASKNISHASVITVEMWCFLKKNV